MTSEIDAQQKYNQIVKKEYESRTEEEHKFTEKVREQMNAHKWQYIEKGTKTRLHDEAKKRCGVSNINWSTAKYADLVTRLERMEKMIFEMYYAPGMPGFIAAMTDFEEHVKNE